MKKLLSLAIIVAMITTFWSCKDDPAADNGVTITGIPATAEIDNLGTVGPVTATIEGLDGLVSLVITKGSAAFDSKTFTGETSATYDFSYTAEAADADKLITFTFTATDKDGDVATVTHVLSVGAAPAPIPNEVLAGLISANKTLTSDRIYELAGRVIVDAGVTLTINPGTIIKGREGNGSLASALIISRGAKIMAEGTAANPIIFTSILDNIQVGEKMGSNLTKIDNEKWGGLIILGKAKISAGTGDTEATIEGLPADEAYGLYGGTDDADNSGVLKYVSIRHGGSLIGEGNEINGLTLGGVGNGTVIDNIEIFATLDDGVELFGGSVNITNLLVYAQGDDGVDIDQNYSGTVSNFAVYLVDGIGTDEGTEIDGPENSTYKDGLFLLQNGYIKSDGGSGQSAADLKAKAQGELKNIVWAGFATAKVKFEGEYTVGDCTDHAGKVYTDAVQNAIDGKLKVTSSKYGELTVYSKSSGTPSTPNCSSIPQTDKNAVAAISTSNAAATGADMSVFTWTLASAKSLLN